jgi:hypothetical protein
MTTIEIKSIFGKVLFTYTNENATIKDAVEQAVKEKVNLRNSDLRNSDLRNSDLSNSDLRGSDLNNSDLRGSNLSGSNIRGAKNKETAYLPIFCKWTHSIIGDKIQIGCKEKTIEEWDIFFASDKVYKTERNTDDFKQIQATYEAYKAYLTFLNK